MKQLQIGVIGNSNPSKEEYKMAEEVGKLIAVNKGIVICGGLGGVMEAVAIGAKSKNGKTIGILPGKNKDSCNDYIDIPIATGFGEARNIIIVNSSDSIIAIGGSFGTLSEISFALKKDIPLIGLNTWNVSDKIIKCEKPKDAVEIAFSLANSSSNDFMRGKE